LGFPYQTRPSWILSRNFQEEKPSLAQAFGATQLQALPAILILVFAPVFAWAGDVPPRELLSAVQDQAVQFAATCPTPRTARLQVKNLTTQALRLQVSPGMLLVPDDLPAPRLVPPNAPARIDLEASIAEVRRQRTAQPGLIAGEAHRGGFGGPRDLRLGPGQSATWDFPFLALRLEQFQPDPEKHYALAEGLPPDPEPRLKRFVSELARRAHSHEVAQAWLWQFLHGLSLRELRLLKPQELNDQEFSLLEHLTDELSPSTRSGPDSGPDSGPNSEPGPLPARMYLQIINKGSSALFPLAEEFRKLTRAGGFLGLPVEFQDVEEAQLQTPAEIASAIGCQMTLGGAPDEGQEVNVRVLLTRWDGLVYSPLREVRLSLGMQPLGRQSLSLLESATLNSLLEFRKKESSEPGTPARVEIRNHFPFTLRGLQVRLRQDSTAAERMVTLSGYALGPGRSLDLELGAPAWALEPVRVTWGR